MTVRPEERLCEAGGVIDRDLSAGDTVHLGPWDVRVLVEQT